MGLKQTAGLPKYPLISAPAFLYRGLSGEVKSRSRPNGWHNNIQYRGLSMKARNLFTSRVLSAMIIQGLAMLLFIGVSCAGSAIESKSSSMLAPPVQEEQLVLKRRLQTAKKDLEAFLLFAENFRKNGDLKTLMQLQHPVEDFLKKHVDNILEQGAEHATLETTRLTAEIMFIKARLQMILNQGPAAKSTIAEMKKRFGSYQKISVELPGKTTTLDEGIRLLDEELAKTAAAVKK
jgi:hypothetical protein